MIIQVIAWIALGAIYLLVGVPMLGSLFTGLFDDSYWDAWKIGALIHFALLVVFAFLFLTLFLIGMAMGKLPQDSIQAIVH